MQPDGAQPAQRHGSGAAVLLVREAARLDGPASPEHGGGEVVVQKLLAYQRPPLWSGCSLALCRQRILSCRPGLISPGRSGCFRIKQRRSSAGFRLSASGPCSGSLLRSPGGASAATPAEKRLTSAIPGKPRKKTASARSSSVPPVPGEAAPRRLHRAWPVPARSTLKEAPGARSTAAVLPFAQPARRAPSARRRGPQAPQLPSAALPPVQPD